MDRSRMDTEGEEARDRRKGREIKGWMDVGLNCNSGG